MKCLLKYQWVKLPRNQLPPGKGIMGAWARLASRAAFRNGHAKYCGYINKISVGGWAGGIVGLKSILGINRRQKALNLMGELADRGYITYSLDSKTKKMTYQVTDWVIRCSGEPCAGREAVYTTEGYGFLCLPIPAVAQRIPDGDGVLLHDGDVRPAGRCGGYHVDAILYHYRRCLWRAGGHFHHRSGDSGRGSPAGTDDLP